MHIPDGMLDAKTFSTLWAGAAGGIGYASYWIRKHLDSGKVVLMAVMAALVFALQMLNFPIAAGTSGHFAGGAAAGIILGAWPATMVMTAVLLVQALFFADGGITTLGANIVNMGIVAPLVAALVYHLGQKLRSGLPSKIICSFLAAWLAVMASSALVAIELWAANRAHFFAALTAMLFWHALIGIGEGLITTGLVAYLARVRPQLLSGSLVTGSATADEQTVSTAAATETTTETTAPVIIQAKAPDSPVRTQAAVSDNSRSDTPVAGSHSLTSVSLVLGLLAIIAAGLSFLASEHPDGLEFVYFDSGLGQQFTESSYVSAAPLSDYLLPGLSDELLATIGAGIIGVILTAALLYTVATLVLRRQQ